MYRFSIEGDEWILRFSPQVFIEAEEKQVVLMSLLQIGNDLSSYSHGDAFLMFTKKIGAIVFDVERIPSFILTVSNIIPEENWYMQDSTLKLIQEYCKWVVKIDYPFLFQLFTEKI